MEFTYILMVLPWHQIIHKTASEAALNGTAGKDHMNQQVWFI